jgi:hypothetical protein
MEEEFRRKLRKTLSLGKLNTDILFLSCGIVVWA